ncbi:phage transcriptional regulator, AlpA [Afipia carboxidovorans OM5]|jgi:predicted DNA-binding transcriptional regulator AlpA|uniref:Helix-turn-helix domain-containing protein n=1 Tax=Afipia carboxidovorans (strain ATCC 49405 / DSM 1227 / KCTC 32145 / OM5) TaxID=504832 RepID=B6JJF5_AFIC5|nr:helix-turn-helix domain-containing protein [Afipia carboxidovorans]ACI94549.1 phage transcriptional regulator, AlpA [Afipia carboxidovorans OM5]AEI01834.1 hypothetical protein OCA4_c06850 [Afipia carboxidovorans OM4]AEI05409.1 hypothetical protein OCA5_c06860 [Afipia carboxidovorans OM5]
MSSKLSNPSGTPPSALPQANPVLLTSKEAARLLNLSVSWLAKRRLAGDGPAYIKMGGAVRYSQAALQQWMKAQQRMSTSGP